MISDDTYKKMDALSSFLCSTSVLDDLSSLSSKIFFSLSVGRALNIRTLRNRTKLPKNKVHNLKRATQKKSVSFERKTRSMNEENLNPTSLLSLKF